MVTGVRTVWGGGWLADVGMIINKWLDVVRIRFFILPI
jgi:hypothetical protein